MRLLLLLMLATTATGACVEVEHDRITAGDLAKAARELAGMPADMIFGFAPQPGLTRNIDPAELRRFAAAHGISMDTDVSLCVEYPVRALTEAEVLAAVRTGFGADGVDIELIDFSRTNVPNGTIVFERRGLAPATATPAPLIWHGFVQYGPQRRALIWAKVRISVQAPRVVSATAISAGHTITEADVRVDNQKHAWTGQPLIAATDAAIGRVAVRAIPAGIALRPEWLAPAPLIKPGDSVDVRVTNGATALQFVAKAATVGQLGQIVMLLNPMTGKTFKATVEGLRTARLDASRSVR
jgi:flagella basal body P-ring formation protein FlgA